MARILREGFENRAVALIFTSVSTYATSTTNPLSGSNSLYSGGSQSSQYARKNLGASYAELYHSFSVVMGSGSTGVLYTWWAPDGTTLLGKLIWNSATKQLSVCVGDTAVATGTATLQNTTRYRIQLRVKIADAGVIQVAVDSDPATTLDIDYSGDTKPGADTGVQYVGFGAGGASGTSNNLSNIYIDDWCINDTAGGADDSWLGDIRLIPFYPNGNGTTSGLTGSDGNQTDNYALVDDLATGANDGDTTYCKATAEGQYDTYPCSDPTIPDGAVFKAVIVEDISRKTNAAVATEARAVMRSDGTDYTGTAHALGIAYASSQTTWLTDPAGGSWDGTKINGLEIGFEGRGAFA